jgi:hypothetical protein
MYFPKFPLSGGRGLYFIIAKTAFKAIRVPINNAALANYERINTPKMPMMIATTNSL